MPVGDQETPSPASMPTPQSQPPVSVYLLFLSSGLSLVQAQSGRSRTCNPRPTSQRSPHLWTLPQSLHPSPPMTDTSSQFPLPVVSPDSCTTSIPRMQLLLGEPGRAGRDRAGGPDADPPHRSGCVLPGSAGPSGARGYGG